MIKGGQGRTETEIVSYGSIVGWLMLVGVPVLGFIGDDWKDSGYDVDIMSSTIDALVKALKDRPVIRRTRALKGGAA